ncbi:hypothetical protein [Streptomyces zaomyceticus]|uniref:hypothetical protein n=1 Tax=Streptomyces zaomyceticus TaxID=68286 RepID=UPI001676694C|nr:hypothetical protein [Streptomyces zaomyceticus]
MQSQKQCGVGDPGDLGHQVLDRRIIAGPDRSDDLVDEYLAGLRNGRRCKRGPTTVVSTAQPFRIRTF